MCVGGAGQGSAAKAQAAENARRQAEAERIKPALQNPEDLLADEATKRPKGRRGLRISLDNAQKSGSGLSISGN